jgi:hypothetical protein
MKGRKIKMKVVPSMRLMKYISFEDGKVVLAKPLPKRLEAEFEEYCKAYEDAQKKRQDMLSGDSDIEN